MIHGSVWFALKVLHCSRTSVVCFSPTENYLPPYWAHAISKLGFIIHPVLWPFCKSDTLSVLIFGNTVYALGITMLQKQSKALPGRHCCQSSLQSPSPTGSPPPSPTPCSAPSSRWQPVWRERIRRVDNYNLLGSLSTSAFYIVQWI